MECWEREKRNKMVRYRPLTELASANEISGIRTAHEVGILIFHKVRALCHRRALSRYTCNARSLRHQHDRAQFTIHFMKEIKILFLVLC